MTTTKTSHFFLRNEAGHRIGVVAMRLEGDEELQVRIAVSLCHGNDAWNSTTGVAAARGRLDARNVNGFENMTFNVTSVTVRGLKLFDVLNLLKPHGMCKKESQVHWFTMQALFERQWKYLTTPPDSDAPKREKSPKVPTRSGYSQEEHEAAIAKERLWIRDFINNGLEFAERGIITGDPLSPIVIELLRKVLGKSAEQIATGTYPRPLVVALTQPKNVQENSDADQ